ncbi:MAG: 4Fe-4S dicluster domain-containing protein [Oscillospiraceae bacterium]|nr:4Fe-4S dicluster domain-containing protein [Oscillospiraceae bacterium]
MEYTITIARQRPGGEKYRQTINYESDTDKSIAMVLTEINSRKLYMTDKQATPIKWECSCLQKKCGACAMVINGRPCLACDRRLSQWCGNVIEIKPLGKFPVIEDLVVDRSVMQEELKAVKAWLDSSSRADGGEVCYEASRCLQCGICLEVCPNFAPGDSFFGMSAAMPLTRLLRQMDDAQRAEVSKLYSRHIYEGCGKSLACRDICPAGIDIEDMLINSNALAVWKRIRKK